MFKDFKTVLGKVTKLTKFCRGNLHTFHIFKITHIHETQLSHIFEILNISNKKTSISNKNLVFQSKPWISMEKSGVLN